MRTHAVLYALVLALLFTLSYAQTYPNNNVTSLEGTWSSGSGAVLTGQDQNGNAFFNPMRRQFTVPPTAGYSYSFTDDGFFEMSSLTYATDPGHPSCFNATLIWQHGTYNITEGRMTMIPFDGDGAVQSMGQCENPPSRLDYYSEMQSMRNWTTFIETDVVFFPGIDSVYGLQMYLENGVPLPKMYLQYRPPRMMPTRSIFKKVIGAPS